MEEEKTLKQYAKEAKKRLKQGFWQSYKKGLDTELKRAKEEGISETSVKEYYTKRVTEDIKLKKNDDEEFYRKGREKADSYCQCRNDYEGDL